MYLEDALKIGAAIMASLGGASFIVIATSSWLAKVWANKILEKEKGEIQKEIERVRSNNKVYLDTLSNSSSLFVESQKSVTAERTEAIKFLWVNFLEIKKSQPPIIVFLDYLPFSDYENIKTKLDMPELDKSLSDEEINNLLNKDAQSVRPFIDEKAFMYFWLYRALLGRFAYYVRGIRKNGAPEQRWQNTKEVIEVVSPVLGNETITIIQNEMWSSRRLLDHVELLLVEHLRELASGKEVSSKSIEHLVELSKKTTALRSNEPADIPN